MAGNVNGDSKPTNKPQGTVIRVNEPNVRLIALSVLTAYKTASGAN